MGRLLTLAFTITTGVCAILLLSAFIHFVHGVNQKRQGKSVDSLVKKCAFVSLFGYTTFVIISFVLYLIQSLYYIPSMHIPYSTLICQMQTFNIVFFMMGKLAMYFYFMSLVHVAFRGSFLAYPVKIIGSMAICFFLLMCVIGAFYMVFLYIDFSAVGPITSPSDCDKFEASHYSSITIWTGATCDAVWSFTCLLLFYLRLRKITVLMRKQSKLERRETDEMLQQIELKRKHSAQCQGEQQINIISNATSSPTVLPTLNEIQSELEDAVSASCTTSRSRSTSATPPAIRHKCDIAASALHIAPDGSNQSHGAQLQENDESSFLTTSVSGMELVDDEEYTLMQYEYQNAPRIVAYDPQRKEAQSSSTKMLISFKLKLDSTSSKIKKQIKRRNSWSAALKVKNEKSKMQKKKPDIVHKFLPIMLKLSILSAWCAFTTFGLGFGLWTLYPTVSSAIDSTVNALCVYLSFGFTKALYQWLCWPFISCRNCENYRTVVKEANKMENDTNFDTQENVLG